MKTYQCSIDISAKSLEEAEEIFCDLTKHWSYTSNRRVLEVIPKLAPELTPEEQGRINMFDVQTKEHWDKVKDHSAEVAKKLNRLLNEE